MGGSNKTQKTETSSGTSTTTLGSTPYATAELDAYKSGLQNAVNMGGYQGDIMAVPRTQENYVAGLNEHSVNGLNAGINWIDQNAPQVQNTASAMGSYWNDVANGVYLDPNTNTALQNYLGTFSESAQDEFARSRLASRNTAIERGAYDNTNYNRENLWASNEFDENMQASLAAILYGNYSDEMARRERATGGAADAFMLGLAPTEAKDTIGERFRIGEQYNLDNEAARNAALTQADQAKLFNDQSRYESNRWGQMEAYERYFEGLNNPAFGQTTQGTSTSQSTQTQKQPLWRDLLGVGAMAAGAITGGPAGAAAGASLGSKLAAPQSMDFSSLVSMPSLLQAAPIRFGA